MLVIAFLIDKTTRILYPRIMPDPSPAQHQIINSPLDSRLFVHGPAGTGKTTAGVARLSYLLEQGVSGESILILTPQRTLQEPYGDAMNSPLALAGGAVTPATISGLAKRMCDLFWPLAAEQAGFAHPDQPPIFLTLETAQYYMAQIVLPLLEKGYFESITIDRNRLYSQIIDNLNKSAIIGFPYTEVGSRLDAAYLGEPSQRRVYADAQECANLFRQFCLDHNLLDFSLQLEIFADILWPQEIVRNYLTRSYRHLIYDNIEEDGPRAHEIIREWMGHFDSALLIFDDGGGYRRFLGANPNTAWSLHELCDERIALEGSFVMSQAISELSDGLTAAITPELAPNVEMQPFDENTLSAIQAHYYPELLDAVANEVGHLMESGVPASEIVILAPYLSDALRFSLTHRLETMQIPWRSHRPSRSLSDEPASHAMLTLAALAHPAWQIHPPKFDAAYMLMQSIQGLDLIRAQLLTEIVYRPREQALAPFEGIKTEMQERITYSIGSRYSILRNWLNEYQLQEALPLDHFFRKLFGEVLSQPGFGYHDNFDSVRVAASLVESVKKFRQALEPAHGLEGAVLGREYLQMLEDGVIAASYIEAWNPQDDQAVLVAPAYSFLMMNRPVSFQFWLDPGSSGWYQRLAQPLTHPYVLSREWDKDKVWNDADETRTAQEGMARLIAGLLHRCREHVYLGLAELSETGYDQRGELLRAFQRVIQNTSQ